MLARLSQKEFQRGPNPWNVYVRKKSLGVTGGRPDTSNFTADYHALGDADKEGLHNRCRIAEFAREAPGHKGGSFGEKSRDIARASHKQRMQERGQQLALTMDANVPRSVVVENAVVAAMQNTQLNSLGEMLAHARRDVLAHSRMLQRERELELKAISDWTRDIGNNVRDQFFAEHRPLAELKDHFVSIPALGTAASTSLVYLPPVCPTANVSLATVRNASNHAVAKACETTMDTLSSLVKHDECDLVPSSKRTRREDTLLAASILHMQ